ncbi:MAG: lysophospholipid acyltransferase family protein [Mycobacteriales bacterium]
MRNVSIAQLLKGGIVPVAQLVFRPVAQGRENVPQKGPVILAANHRSFIDSVILTLVAPRPVAFLTKAEYFQASGLRAIVSRWLFTAMGAIPVERGKHRSAQASLDQALDVLNAGHAFGIYPEGTRSIDGRLYRGHTGVAWLALTTRAPVIPVALVGTDRIQPVGARLPASVQRLSASVPRYILGRYTAPRTHRRHDEQSPPILWMR